MKEFYQVKVDVPAVYRHDDVWSGQSSEIVQNSDANAWARKQRLHLIQSVVFTVSLVSQFKKKKKKNRKASHRADVAFPEGIKVAAF